MDRMEFEYHHVHGIAHYGSGSFLRHLTGSPSVSNQQYRVTKWPSARNHDAFGEKMHNRQTVITLFALSATLVLGVYTSAFATCRLTTPLEKAQYQAVTYPVHVSFHVPKNYQDEENWKNVKQVVSSVNRELKNLLQDRLFYISLKDTLCDTENTHKVCIAADSTMMSKDGQEYLGLWHYQRDGSMGEGTLAIPNFKIDIAQSHFESEIAMDSEYSKRRREFNKTHKIVVREKKERYLQLKKELDITFINLERTENALKMIALEIEECDVIECEESKLASLDQQKKQAETGLQHLQTEIDRKRPVVDSEREKWKTEDQLRFLTALEKTLVHEFLHAVGFDHSRAKNEVMSAMSCHSNTSECHNVIGKGSRQTIYREFRCLVENIGHNEILHDAYRFKAQRELRSSHSRTSKLEDCTRAMNFDERWQERRAGATEEEWTRALSQCESVRVSD